MATPAVFLDRDGTMIRDVGYLARAEDVEWFPFSLDAIRLLNRAGFAVVVVTNQGGVGLGLFTEDFVRDVHRRLDADVVASGGRVAAWLHCPHHPRSSTPSLAGPCECRKPSPGLVHQAQRELDLDVSRSFVVGDKWSDVDLARQAGARGILVRTGYGEGELARAAGRPPASHVASDLMAATTWILNTHAAEGAPS